MYWEIYLATRKCNFCLYKDDLSVRVTCVLMKLSSDKCRGRGGLLRQDQADILCSSFLPGAGTGHSWLHHRRDSLLN